MCTTLFWSWSMVWFHSISNSLNTYFHIHIRYLFTSIFLSNFNGYECLSKCLKIHSNTISVQVYDTRNAAKIYKMEALKCGTPMKIGHMRFLLIKYGIWLPMGKNPYFQSPIRASNWKINSPVAISFGLINAWHLPASGHTLTFTFVTIEIKTLSTKQEVKPCMWKIYNVEITYSVRNNF